MLVINKLVAQLTGNTFAPYAEAVSWVGFSNFQTARLGGSDMPLIKVKTKYQVTPTAVRRKVGLEVGDLLEVRVKGNKITLTPKSAIDRELALALEDIKQGRTLGPFKTAKEAIRALRRAAK